MIEALLALVLAAGPVPDPHPAAAPGKIRFVAYSYVTKDRRDGRPVRCVVPVRGKRVCVRLP